MKHSKVKTLKSKKEIERKKTLENNIFKSALFIVACLVLFFSILIVGYIISKGIKGSLDIGVFDFLFGSKYDGVTLFGTGFMIINTLWTSILSIIITIPISVITALFITRIAPQFLKTTFFVILSILAAIPSVIYGAFGSKVMDYITINIFNTLSGSLLTIVLTLSFMIMPTVTLITSTSINVIDKKLEDSSLALGATKNQTCFKITLRAAQTGILTGAILGIGRALGEATAVSMISVDPYTGPSFGLFNQIRLLTATMLKGYNELEPGSLQESSMFAMGMMLIITILIVFISLRFIQKTNDPVNKSKKASKKINKFSRINNHIDKNGSKDLSIKDQKLYNEFLKNHELIKKVDSYYHKQYKMQIAIQKTTIKKNNEKQKKITSNNLGILTWLISAIGVIFLISIIMFLFIGGINSLSWNLIQTSGSININGNNVNGLKPSIFGTMILIFISMVLIIPLGIGTGIYFAVFAKKETRLTKVLLLGIDVLAGIPSLIFGLIGAVIFLPLSKILNFIPLSGSIILTLIVTPTVVQTTQESINSVPKSIINGSLALGSTKTTSSIKIALPQALPQIIGGVILSIGRIIGESAALIMIFGTISRGALIDWTHYGGTTLATEMYSLTLLEVIPWDVVSAIGMVIISFVLLLALLANYISEKKWWIVGFVIISLGLIITGLLNSIFIIFIFGISLLAISLIIKILFEIIKTKII